jgi:sigma-B regulation protein RsbU (phosphoserine phosphatase)
VGGDYYEIMPLNGREIVFSVNDVAGHGIPASLLMAVFHSNFVFNLSHGGDIAATIGNLNRLLAETTDASLYVTSFTCRIDAAGGVLEYINAGHPPPLVLRGGGTLLLDAGGFAVGMFAASEYLPVRFHLLQGDLLVFYTDGVIEAANEREEEYSRERLAAAVAAHRDLPAAELQAALLADIRAFCGRTEFEDDLTLMIVKYLGKDELSSRVTRTA